MAMRSCLFLLLVSRQVSISFLAYFPSIFKENLLKFWKIFFSEFNFPGNIRSLLDLLFIYY